MGTVAFGISPVFTGPNFCTLDDAKNAISLSPPESVYFQRFPSDPIGTFVLTLNNVVVGSRVHVEKLSDGTQYYDALAAASTVVISFSAYSVGSAYNDLRVKVRKGSSAQKYLPFETYATAVIGSASIFVAQVPDTIAS